MQLRALSIPCDTSYSQRSSYRITETEIYLSPETRKFCSWKTMRRKHFKLLPFYVETWIKDPTNDIHVNFPKLKESRRYLVPRSNERFTSYISFNIKSMSCDIQIIITIVYTTIQFAFLLSNNPPENHFPLFGKILDLDLWDEK